MTALLPSNRQPIASVRGGLAFVDPVWQRWFNSFTSSPQPFAPATVTTSPFTATVINAGSYFVSGGTVTGISIRRGQTTLTTGMTSGFFPVGNSDVFSVEFSAPPTIQFVPN